MTPGNPSPRSPFDVMQDRAYRMMDCQGIGAGFVRLTVFHGGTETLWQTEYFQTASSAPANWWQAERVIVTRSEYRRIAG